MTLEELQTEIATADESILEGTASRSDIQGSFIKIIKNGISKTYFIGSEIINKKIVVMIKLANE